MKKKKANAKAIHICNYSHFVYCIFDVCELTFRSSHHIIQNCKRACLAYLYDFIFSNTKIETGFLSLVLTFGYFYFLGYYGLKQSKILLPEFLLSSIKEHNPSEIIKNIDRNKLKEYSIKITEVLTKEKIYLDDELTLHKFAKTININEKKLSAILNQEMNISFYNLINSYRIEEFKRRISSNEFQNLTVIGIAFDCGFKSKSTFHRLFKLNTGKTPKDYKNSLKSLSQSI